MNSIICYLWILYSPSLFLLPFAMSFSIVLSISLRTYMFTHSYMNHGHSQNWIKNLVWVQDSSQIEKLQNWWLITPTIKFLLIYILNFFYCMPPWRIMKIKVHWCMHISLAHCYSKKILKTYIYNVFLVRVHQRIHVTCRATQSR